MKVLIIIPAYNEEKNIAAVLEEIRSDFCEADVVVVNDCSKDNTSKIVKLIGDVCLDLPFNMGYASALQCGFKYAVEKSYDYVVQFDGDGQHVASEAKKLYETAIQTQADIIIGSRFLSENEYKHSFFRKLGTKVFSLLIRLSCGKQISDPTSGLQVLSRNCFRFFSSMDNYPEFPDANLIIEMLKKKYSIVEVTVSMRNRLEGVSMHNGILKPVKYMIVMFYSIFILMIKQHTANTSNLVVQEKGENHDN